MRYRIEQYYTQKGYKEIYIKASKGEKKIEVNWGVGRAIEMLNIIASTKEWSKDFKLIIIYEKGNLKYYIEKRASEDGKAKISVEGINIELEEIQKEVNPYIYKRSLFGGIPVEFLNKVSLNLIDTLIMMLPNENFRIDIGLSVLERENGNERLKELNKSILGIQRETSANVQLQDNAGKNIIKSTFGGKNVSYTITDEHSLATYNRMVKEYQILEASGLNFYCPEITVQANSQQVLESIVSSCTNYNSHNAVDNPYYLASEYGDVPKYIPALYVAGLMAFPTKKVNGFKINQLIEYGVVDKVDNREKEIGLGNIYTTTDLDNVVAIKTSDLTKHAFVCGVTGSGKTSTIKSLLYKLNVKDIPFLIFEPAKTEYKYLSTLVGGLTIYTLGIENEQSFKINPFSFPEFIPLQMHLDLIKSVFIAAFPMYGPMPYILEQALYKIYEKYGWDFVTGQNIYAKEVERSQLFPKLSDLYNEINQVTDSVGYSDETQSDVKGALRVRIGSLMSGAKGTMLNTNESTDIYTLLSTPSIMELEYIGDNQEKIFMMGLILISIYEYYISKGAHEKDLKNLLVIEEAHRLLPNVVASNNNEVADVKGKAIEIFNDILSEIRTYGQGILVADQIPGKLSPDVIKNSNLKIIHKLYAEDDRKNVGSSIGLNKEQIEDIIRLDVGQAVVFHGELSEAIKIKVEVDKACLASSQSTVKRPITSEFINMHQYIISNSILNKEFEKLINTYLLIGDTERLEQNFKTFIERYRLGEDVGVDLISVLLAYFPSNEKYNNLYKEYVSKAKDYERLKNSERAQVFSVFREILLDKMKKYQHVYDAFAEYYRFLKFLVERSELRITWTLENIELIKQNDESLYNFVLEQMGANGVIDIQSLRTIEKQKLIDAYILLTFEDRLEQLDYYFESTRNLEVEDMNIGDFSEVRVIQPQDSGISGIEELIDLSTQLIKELQVNQGVLMKQRMFIISTLIICVLGIIANLFL